MAEGFTILMIVLLIVIIIIGIIIIAISFSNKAEGISGRQDIEENAPQVDYYGDDPKLKGHIRCVRIGSPLPTNDGDVVIVTLKPTDIKTKNREVPKEKLDLVVDVPVHRNRYIQFGTALGTEREKEFIYPLDMNITHPQFRASPLGRMTTWYMGSVETYKEMDQQKSDLLQTWVDFSRQLHITDPLKDELIKRSKTLLSNPMPMKEFGKRDDEGEK